MILLEACAGFLFPIQIGRNKYETFKSGDVLIYKDIDFTNQFDEFSLTSCEMTCEAIEENEGESSKEEEVYEPLWKDANFSSLCSVEFKAMELHGSVMQKLFDDHMEIPKEIQERNGKKLCMDFQKA